VCLALLWLFYLSLVAASPIFLNYQWDSLLLESGLLAILLTPWGLRLGRAGDAPWPFSIWLVRWLVFRLMFLSGVVKLTSGDPVWHDWKALEYHYQTQPIPAWSSWYMHQMPPWFQSLSVGIMFYAELVAPFLIFGPRRLRWVGFVTLVLLQVLIATTGNYGFFNFLAVVLCLSLLDDRDWNSLARQRPVITHHSSWSWPRRILVGGVGGLLIAVTAAQTMEAVWPSVGVPVPVQMVAEWLEPLRSANPYGLFRVMTTKRPEITVEGSDDGETWKPYRFRWKPDELDRAPRFAILHLPRLDWQMWFAALAGHCGSVPWFLRFERRLLAGTPEVLGLLRENPFPDHPPRFIRARLALYSFTRRGSKDWWQCDELGLFCPEVARGE
jgi:hypothetical protein